MGIRTVLGWCALIIGAIQVSAAPAGVFTHGPATCHAVAFTFDLCPVSRGSGFDAPLVKFLVDHQVHATFFVSGKWIATHDAEMRQLIAQPFFEIGTHGQVHAHLPTLTTDAQSAEIHGPVATLAKRYSVTTTLFRPPYGEYNDDSVRQAEAQGQTFVTWSIVSGDPDPNLSAERIVADVLGRARNGSIVIFHANGRGWHTAEVVPAVYKALVETKHFAAETVTELRGCQGQHAR